MNITLEVIKHLKSKDTVIVDCEQCSCQFKREVGKIRENISKGSSTFCSLKCFYANRVTSSKVPCLYCGNDVIKKKGKTTNTFCNSSCFAFYNNKHRTKGNRRSRAEEFLENLIKREFPNHKMQTNVRDIIPDGLEVDILLPELNIAIELNGPIHYFPIHGQEYLEKMTDRDIRKQVYLQKAGYNLIVLNISELRYWKTDQIKLTEMYEKVIKPLL